MNFPKRNLRRSLNGKLYSGNKNNKSRTNSEDNKKNYYESADSSPLKNKTRGQRINRKNSKNDERFVNG